MTPLAASELLDALTTGLAAAARFESEAFAICIVDGGGHVLGSVRDPAAAISAGHSAETKARTAIYLLADTGGMPATSPIIPAMAAGLPAPVNFFEGGLLLRRNGVAVGAVGVGGSTTPGHDLAVARAVRAALAPDTDG